MCYCLRSYLMLRLWLKFESEIPICNMIMEECGGHFPVLLQFTLVAIISSKGLVKIHTSRLHLQQGLALASSVLGGSV